MATIAIAGGTNGLGLTIAETLAIHGGYDVGSAELEKKLPARLVVVDYSNIESLVVTLESNNIGTVISTINATGNSLPERNLVCAAERSSKTTVFIPSIFAGFDYPIKSVPTYLPYQSNREKKLKADVYHFTPIGTRKSHPIAKTKFEVLEELRKTSLTYTSVINGMFMDYYVSPFLKSHVKPFPMFVGRANKKAAIPGSRRCQSHIVGDRVTLREFLEFAEAARGSRFQVTYYSREDLEAGRLTGLPCYTDTYNVIGKEQVKGLYTQVGLWVADREMDLQPSFTLNSAIPGLKPMTLKEFLDLSWRV
ncbi:hypothetical protein BBP40_004133 [Aspergillus hancockii]|nr:hypothetical protein BBP40_004133 [Aspergillus hancockii]